MHGTGRDRADPTQGEVQAVGTCALASCACDGLRKCGTGQSDPCHSAQPRALLAQTDAASDVSLSAGSRPGGHVPRSGGGGARGWGRPGSGTGVAHTSLLPSLQGAARPEPEVASGPRPVPSAGVVWLTRAGVLFPRNRKDVCGANLPRAGLRHTQNVLGGRAFVFSP